MIHGMISLNSFPDLMQRTTARLPHRRNLDNFTQPAIMLPARLEDSCSQNNLLPKQIEFEYQQVSLSALTGVGRRTLGAVGGPSLSSRRPIGSSKTMPCCANSVAVALEMNHAKSWIAARGLPSTKKTRNVVLCCTFCGKHTMRPLTNCFVFCDARDRFELGKTDQRPLKKRKARLREDLEALQSPTPFGSVETIFKGAVHVPYKYPSHFGIKRKARFAAALPLSQQNAFFGPVFSTLDSNPVSERAVEKLIHDQWRRHTQWAATDENAIEIFSSNYSHNFAATNQSFARLEHGIVSIHLTEILLRLYESDDAEERKAAVSFERAKELPDYDQRLWGPSNVLFC